MNKETVLRSLRINHVVAFAATLVIVAAFECGFVAKGVLAGLISSSAYYMLQVATVMLTVILVPMAIKSFTKAAGKCSGMSEGDALKLYTRMSMQRTVLVFLVIIINGFAYYGLGYEGSLYCGLFGYGSMIYAFPTKMVMEQFLQGKTDK